MVTTLGHCNSTGEAGLPPWDAVVGLQYLPWDTEVTQERQGYHPGTLYLQPNDRVTTMGRCSHTGETELPSWDTVVTSERQGCHSGTLKSHWGDRVTSLGYCSHTGETKLPPRDTVVTLERQRYHPGTL